MMRHSRKARNNLMNREELLRDFDRWPSGLKCHWFGTLTFERKEIPLWITKRAFDEWMLGILGDDPDLYFRWLLVTEFRPSGENPRLHIFCRMSRVASKYVWMAHWKTLVSGNADIFYAFASRGAKHYLVNAVHRESRFEIKEDDQN
jgi:hypothetical protein